MNKRDRDFIYLLEKCETKRKIQELINDIDDDEVQQKMNEYYEQILEFNQNETEKNIIIILDYRYRQVFQNKENN